MADKKAPEETEEKTQAKEHDVSIVLSYMDDEHEKAAIEVREMPPPPQPRRRRFWFFVICTINMDIFRKSSSRISKPNLELRWRIALNREFRKPPGPKPLHASFLGLK